MRTAAATPATAAAGGAAQGAGTPGGTLTIALNSELTTMDPHKSTAAVDRQVFQNIFDKLVDIDTKLNIVPGLATKWTISDDGKTYTFTLVEGVKFHDGTDFNADAVKANFERMLAKETASPRKSEIAQVTKVDAPDAKTVVLTLSQAYSPLLATLSDRAGMIISPKAIKEKGDDLARSPVGTGAFSFVEWKKDDHLTIKKNPDYWRKGQPLLDQVVYKPVTDATVRLTGLTSGEVQMIDSLSPKDVDKTKKNSALVYDEVAGLGYNYISLHTGKPPFANKALRQAVAWAIDRDAINHTIYFDTGAPAQTGIPPSSWAFDPSVEVYKQDYDMAKKKLAEGGQPNGFSFTMLVTNTPDSIQLAEAYKAQLAEAKIVANLELLEFGTLLDRSNKGDFEAVSIGWSGRPDPDGNIYSQFHSGGGLNSNDYSNPDVDKLLEQTRAVADPAERKKLYSQADKLIADDAPLIFIHFPAEQKIWLPAAQGFVHVPDGMMRMHQVWLKK